MPPLPKRILAALAILFVILVVTVAKKGERRRSLALLAGWALPGAGHALMGRWGKGAFFLVLLSATFLCGLWITGFRFVSFDDNPFYYFGQFGSGAAWLTAFLLSAEKAFPVDAFHPSWFDPGLLYVCVAGLLNVVVVLNVLDVRPAGVAPAPAAAPPAPLDPPGAPASVGVTVPPPEPAAEPSSGAEKAA